MPRTAAPTVVRARAHARLVGGNADHATGHARKQHVERARLDKSRQRGWTRPERVDAQEDLLGERLGFLLDLLAHNRHNVPGVLGCDLLLLHS
jgi:hypothetical protein